ncbi:leucine-rich repeat protein [Slackia piriformis]|nr:leucine-rich repeat protein [Slackia piriformis]
MIVFPFVAVLFVAMLLFPVVGSYVMYRRGAADVLFINADKTKDPRFFAKSFDRMMTRAFDCYEGGRNLVLSRKPEPFYMASDDLPEICDRIVVSLDDLFDSGEVKSFEREVYACGSALVRPNSEVRALYAMESASLGGGSVVDRWIDAEGVLAVYDDCDLGVSASSASHLVIGRNCSFRRLYAPVIDVGTYYDELEDPASLSRTPFVSREVIWGKRSLDEGDRNEELDCDDANDDGVIVGTVVTSHNLKVLEDLVVAGDIRSHHSVRLCDRAVVFGNIFAENGVVLGEGCRVLGTIFCQDDVRIGDGAVIGTKGQERSVVARGRVIFEGRARVYGYVTTEGGGGIVLDEETGDSPENRFKRTAAVMPPEAVKNIIAEPTLEELGLASAAYRKSNRVVAARIPLGATEVPRSMFYRCAHLSNLEIPDTVERIEDFAFFGCEHLEQIDLRHCVSLREIGVSAFEGCFALKQVYLPYSLEAIGEAAFRNCGKLERVAMSHSQELYTIGSHAFQGCVSLSSVKLPNRVSSIGMSSFYGCASLASLFLPDSVEDIGPYFVAECPALNRLSISRELKPEESVGLPDRVVVEVRASGQSDEGEASEAFEKELGTSVAISSEMSHFEAISTSFDKRSGRKVDEPADGERGAL